MFSNCKWEKRRRQKNEKFQMSVTREGKEKEVEKEMPETKLGAKQKSPGKYMESRLSFHSVL